MPLDNVLAVIAVEIVLGLVTLVLLWPVPRSATKLLRRWGVGDPTEDEVAQALTYLRRRRVWYPWLLIGLPAALTGTGLLPAGQDTTWLLPSILLLGALLAELFAQRRDPSPVRAAVPVRRELTDIVPRWALVLHATAAIAAFVLLGAALAGAGWARNWHPSWSERVLWLSLGAALVTVVTVWAVVGLALRRPPVAQLRIDPLLRTRSARVPLGLGTATLCALIGGDDGGLRGMLVVLAGLALWSAIAGPQRQQHVPA
ncbi:hypothetical protein AB5J62_22840 [Amycolatopsis sp. cg5]|uniref:hypothetical protein n=1 Tax=Amycolatopsis sp. cg5 TaxID=3238802 RepID=UPI003525783B